MYGLPDNAPLSRVVNELCRVHERTVEDTTGLEAPLLYLLERAVASDMGRGSVSGVSGVGGVLNLAALDLWRKVCAVVAEHWPGRGDLQQANTPVIQRLEVWASSLAGTDDEIYLLDLCHNWHEAIRNLLEPPKEVPLRGVTCPTCKRNRVLVENADREYVYQPPLLAYLSETPVRVTCRDEACRATWFGPDLAYIAAAEDFLLA